MVVQRVGEERGGGGGGGGGTVLASWRGVAVWGVHWLVAVYSCVHTRDFNSLPVT